MHFHISLSSTNFCGNLNCRVYTDKNCKDIAWVWQGVTHVIPPHLAVNIAMFVLRAPPFWCSWLRTCSRIYPRKVLQIFSCNTAVDEAEGSYILN